MTTYSSSKRGHYNNEQVVFEDTKLTSSITPQNENKTLPYQINLKWFKCKFCDTIFYDNFDKLIHTRQMHQAEEEQQQLLNSATPSNSEKVIQDVPLQRINSEKFQKTSHKRKISQMETINVPPSPMNLTPPPSKIICIFQNNEGRSNNTVILQHQKIINCKFCDSTTFSDNFEKLIHTMKEHQTTSSPNDSEKKLQNTKEPELIREKEKCKKIFASVMAKLRAKKCK